MKQKLFSGDYALRANPDLAAAVLFGAPEFCSFPSAHPLIFSPTYQPEQNQFISYSCSFPVAAMAAAIEEACVDAAAAVL